MEKYSYKMEMYPAFNHNIFPDRRKRQREPYPMRESETEVLFS